MNNTLSATSETLAALGGAGSPLPVRANHIPATLNGVGGDMMLQGFPRGGTQCRHRTISSGRAGADGSGLGVSQPVHNFSDDCANGPRIVCVGIGLGVSLPFVYFPFFHSGDL